MWQRIKNWITKKFGWTAICGTMDSPAAEEAIHLLGGFTENDALELMQQAGEIAVTEYQRGHATNLVTAQSELRLSEHPSFTPDDVIERGYNYTIRQLGEAVYPYAHHFLTEDGLYIASVEVLKGENE